VEKVAECVMVSTISFIQAKLQRSIAASRVLTRTVRVIDIALKQEPWYQEGRIMGLNIPGYTLLSAGGIDRLRARILARNVNIWMLPGVSYRDLVAVLINYNEDEAERWLVVCSAYLFYDSKNPVRQRSMRCSCITVNKNSI
jgi:hypothetical protein